ncbi:hypothetical protein [Streptomyces sp. KN37]|uniref:hypothetical protein n=1 Tax=Streptomyces sp. KN37 TaxID=3090667 RepID=UPI002A74A84A|nr:hypothetical protein [Streptomyces sp. KN37]WPO70235.1 hypothetical protein R9806_06125 [Streptomyces sp. KN37]WPO73995.1 hypothetical protein R9806_26940 [Streptomyces sp. KN37]
MTSQQPWTIDAIAHAIPAADTRQTFLREVNLTPLPELPDVLARWQRFVERWHDEDAPRLDAALEYAKAHHGELPPEYRETPESRTAWEQWEQTMRQHQGHSAA